MKLYIDIETVPAQSEETRLAIMDGVKPPAQYKKEES
ncbi:MAG: ribonuclease H, partial [Oxalobacter sp.]|nr:ribonuclease H [Oxalobacter sp.]